MKKKYTFKESKTIILDIGEGRVLTTFMKDPVDVEASLRLAKWVHETMDELGSHYGQNGITVLSDVRKLKTVPMNAHVRREYMEISESPYTQKVAGVGNEKNYLKLISIKALLVRHRERLQFFSSIEDAKIWLGWTS